MIITDTMAQQIVDSVMSIVSCNVQIMDLSGTIIGSKDHKRIRIFHQGAKNAIDNKQGIEIFPEQVDSYSGTLPGIDLPIVLDDQVVGVVGISGNPDEVRDIAKLAKSMIELMLEREGLREEFRSQDNIQEQFVSLLLLDVANSNIIKRNANLLRFDLTVPRVVAVIDIKAFLEQAYKTYVKSDLISARVREQELQLVRNSTFIDNQDLVVYWEQKIVILKQVALDTTQESIHKWGQGLYNYLSASNKESFAKIGIGSIAKEWPQFKESYSEALFALRYSCSNDISLIYDYDILTRFLLEKSETRTWAEPLTRSTKG